MGMSLDACSASPRACLGGWESVAAANARQKLVRGDQILAVVGNRTRPTPTASRRVLVGPSRTVRMMSGVCLLFGTPVAQARTLSLAASKYNAERILAAAADGE